MKMILSAEEGKKIAIALRQYAKDNNWTDSDYEDFLAEEYGEIINVVFRTLGIELCVDTSEDTTDIPHPLSDVEFKALVEVTRLFVNRDEDGSYFTEKIACHILNALRSILNNYELDDKIYDDVVEYYWLKLADTLDCHLVKKG